MMRRNLWKYTASVAMLAVAVWLAQRTELGKVDPRSYSRVGVMAQDLLASPAWRDVRHPARAAAITRSIIASWA